MMLYCVRFCSNQLFSGNDSPSVELSKLLGLLRTTILAIISTLVLRGGESFDYSFEKPDISLDQDCNSQADFSLKNNFIWRSNNDQF